MTNLQCSSCGARHADFNRIVVIACCVFWTCLAHATNPFKRLSAGEIRDRLVGKVVTDEAHWSHRYLPHGTAKLMDLGQQTVGSWKLRNDELCVIRKERKAETTDCYEIWLAKDKVEYRRYGVTAAEGILKAEP